MVELWKCWARTLPNARECCPLREPLEMVFVGEELLCRLTIIVGKEHSEVASGVKFLWVSEILSLSGGT